MILFNDIYNRRRVLLTGHTGFKGSWLALWLAELGAEITGISLDPSTDPNHWDLLGVNIVDIRLDVRDFTKLNEAVKQAKPEVIFHLAAQPLVRRSYRDPLETWSTNVMGTVNVLEAARACPDLKAIVVITTDKCYENREWVWGYRECDRLGGYDPYSASKACVEMVVHSYRKSFFNELGSPLVASARAGNVIGGGDWSEDRLIPDLIRAVGQKVPLIIRSPEATRPWQHVLESLSGYLLLGQYLLDGEKQFADAWNFGPDTESNQQVQLVLSKLMSEWPELRWQQAENQQLHEATLLHLDSTKARDRLKWRPVWSLDQGLVATADWYRSYMEAGRVASREQLRDYIEQAVKLGSLWCHQ